MLRLRSQGYDGASNMRGEFNGLIKKILDENKYAFYIHCFAHQLQLFVVATASEFATVSYFFDHLGVIVNIVGASCKRKDAIRQKQHEDLVECIEMGEISTGKGKNQEMSLAWAGDTRWGSHFKTIHRLLDLWKPVKEVLIALSKEAIGGKNRGAALGLVDKMESFEFVFIAHLMLNLLGPTNDLSQALQLKNQNIGNAIQLIEDVKRDLKNYRDGGWDELLKEVTTFCSKNEIHVHDMEDIIPGRIRRTIDDEPQTYLHYFRVNIFYQVVDILSNEMEERFTKSNSNSKLLMCISCLDPRDSFQKFDSEKLIRLAELYSKDFVGSDIHQLRIQLDRYIFNVKHNDVFSNLHDIGELAKKMVEMRYHVIYDLVCCFLELALVLPVATATVERSFSAMKFIKNDLRNMMGDNFLTDLLVCYMEKGVFTSVENEEILQRFQDMGTRRSQLPATSLHRLTKKK